MKQNKSEGWKITYIGRVQWVVGFTRIHTLHLLTALWVVFITAATVIRTDVRDVLDRLEQHS